MKGITVTDDHDKGEELKESYSRKHWLTTIGEKKLNIEL